MGSSLFFQQPSVLTSFVYSGLPFATGTDPKQFTVMPASVPEAVLR